MEVLSARGPCEEGVPTTKVGRSSWSGKRKNIKARTHGSSWFPCIVCGHINPAITFGLFLARKVSLPRAMLYIVAQCLGAICGAGLVKAFQKQYYVRGGGAANSVAVGYSMTTAFGAEIVGTFIIVYTVFSATDPKRNARDSHVPVLAPLPIGFAVFIVHLATIPITGTGINPARSFGTAVIYGHQKTWEEQWIFWLGPLVGGALAAGYHQHVLRAGALKAIGSFRAIQASAEV